jgi:hypothetical protein
MSIGNWPDVVNGMFELFAAPFICLSIKKLIRDKQIHGVSWVHASFFSAWGFWNLFYYPHLGQWFSFIGGIAVVTTNTAWVLLMLWYSVFNTGIVLSDVYMEDNF